ncbi:MAG: hypothetical protein R2939_20150 [Kofleriaceae bacterium]
MPLTLIVRALSTNAGEGPRTFSCEATLREGTLAVGQVVRLRAGDDASAARVEAIDRAGETVTSWSASAEGAATARLRLRVLDAAIDERWAAAPPKELVIDEDAPAAGKEASAAPAADASAAPAKAAVEDSAKVAGKAPEPAARRASDEAAEPRAPKGRARTAGPEAEAAATGKRGARAPSADAGPPWADDALVDAVLDADAVALPAAVSELLAHLADSDEARADLAQVSGAAVGGGHRWRPRRAGRCLAGTARSPCIAWRCRRRSRRLVHGGARGPPRFQLAVAGEVAASCSATTQLRPRRCPAACRGGARSGGPRWCSADDG